jgi:hypothetical protein
LHNNTNYLYYTVFHIHRQELEFVTCSIWIWTVLKTCWYVTLRIGNCNVSECVGTKLPRMRHTQPDNVASGMGHILKYCYVGLNTYFILCYKSWLKVLCKTC